MKDLILAGDLGGTKTLLGLFQKQKDALVCVREQRFESREFVDFDALLAGFVPKTTTLAALCLGVAGPVVEGVCHTTNLPWHLSEAALREAWQCPSKLLNDLEAAALGMLHEPAEAVLPLWEVSGPVPRANRAVLAAGTGLGEAILYWDGARYQPLATEGGHTDFAPCSSQDVGLLGYLQSQFGEHVSWERVLSGAGFVQLYSYLTDVLARPRCVPVEHARAHDLDPSPVITAQALVHGDATCMDVLQWFGRLYGAEAGNLVLKCFGIGGVMLGGNIAQVLGPVLREGCFREGFLAKGRYRALLEKVPVSLVSNTRVALLGAAHYGARALR